MKAKLSMAFETLVGKDGNVVISRGRTGLVLRPRVTSRNPKTGPQKQVRSNLAKAAATFKNLTSNQFLSWTNYAHGITKKNPISGDSYHPTAINEFVALATKFLQVNPTGTIPLTPPSAGFAGDVIAVTATPVTNGIKFTASAANSKDVTTEFLIQPLASKNRTPSEGAYRSKGFTAFTAGTLNATVNLAPGNYAVAIRFVNSVTGQEAEITPIGLQLVTFAVAQGNQGGKAKAA